MMQMLFAKQNMFYIEFILFRVEDCMSFRLSNNLNFSARTTDNFALPSYLPTIPTTAGENIHF